MMVPAALDPSFKSWSWLSDTQNESVYSKKFFMNCCLDRHGQLRRMNTMNTVYLLISDGNKESVDWNHG